MTATKASLAVDEETQAHLRSRPGRGRRRGRPTEGGP
jgi:hypothetical protein